MNYDTIKDCLFNATPTDPRFTRSISRVGRSYHRKERYITYQKADDMVIHLYRTYVFVP